MNISLRKITQHWIVKIVLGITVCILGILVIKKAISQPILGVILDSQELKDGIQNLISGFVIIVIYYVFYKLLEKRKIHELSLNKIEKDLSIGISTGFGLISLCIGILYLLGYFEVYNFNEFSGILLPLTLLLSAALFEEVIFRGIIYRILEERFGTNIALSQAFFFGVLHYGNANATITSVWFVIMLGIVLSLLYTYTQRLWLPFFFHFSWNFAQIVYGTPLSGNTNFDALLSSKFNGPSLFIGSEFGIEDSFFSILFMTLLAFYLYWMCKKKGKLKPLVSYLYKKAQPTDFFRDHHL
ncbi:type II CAAX endopeptidase family protein [uncultured Aquimarina sp.]|uniref:CPBP family intramembrane glutamic endopeptidase n=1 Tax=uncultured Aquimarina sp. TaxID=575652 RepID=UPI002633640A|nr:type II CAAX endopeptidase family protein [uncultured Aquimarina sp.]